MSLSLIKSQQKEPPFIPLFQKELSYSKDILEFCAKSERTYL